LMPFFHHLDRRAEAALKGETFRAETSCNRSQADVVILGLKR